MSRATAVGRVGSRNCGFSLIEMLVAMVILSVSLGLLYQATAGATRNVRSDERYVYAVLLGQSLLAEHQWLLSPSIKDDGDVEGFRWSVEGNPLAPSAPEDRVALSYLNVTIEWLEGDKRRQVVLETVVPVLDDDS